ncbi:MAG: FTR1 family protein [Nitrososphaeria archaeon]|nr:FTR1 family protein [Nitrososphaeria archaeon]
MMGQYLIAFRETFEAALVSAIMFSYLIRTGRSELTRFVWYGIYLAVGLSTGLGALISFTYGILPKPFQLLFEAAAAFVAVVVLSSIIFWMAVRGRHFKKEIEKRIESTITGGTIVGLLTISFIIVFREGLETVLFLTPFLLNETMATIAGSVAGIISALILSYGIFAAGMKINLRKFFYFTSLLLIFLASGLAGYSVHELIEYYEQNGFNLGWLAEPAYVLNLPEENILHHKNIVGSILAVMFGYTVEAEWARIIVHLLYLAISLPFIIWVYRRRK